MNRVVYSSRDIGSMRRLVPELIRAREMLLDLVSKEVRAQYRHAVLGFMWAVLEPLLMTLILTFVFSLVFRSPMPEVASTGAPYSVLLLCAYLFWKFFADSLSRATASLVDNNQLINKVNFPREIIPLSSIGFCFVNLAIGFFIFLIIHLVLGGRVSSAYIWLPFVFGVECALVVGLALIFSAYNAAFRDVRHMVGVGLVLGFYATPIFYTLGFVHEQIARQGTDTVFMKSLLFLYGLNPMVGIITALREVLIANQVPTLSLMAWPTVCGVAVLALGIYVFRRRTGTLADYL